MRADASRNAAAILDAARAVMGEQGLAAPMSAIAARAGVAVGTLYRHHPTKQDLVAAVAGDSVRRIRAEAEDALTRVEAGGSATDEVLALLQVVGLRHATDRVFKGVFPPGEDRRVDEEQAALAVAALLARAQDEGGVRADVTLEDVLLLLAGTPGAPADEDARRTYLRVVAHGLRP